LPILPKVVGLIAESGRPGRTEYEQGLVAYLVASRRL
jgi:hypothetical protein